MRYHLVFPFDDSLESKYMEYDVPPIVGDLLRFENESSVFYFKVLSRVFIDEHLVKLALERV